MEQEKPIPILAFKGEYAFLSNFYRSRIKFRGVLTDHPDGCNIYDFQSVEHAYQAHKAIRFTDFIRVQQAPTPGAAKRVGRSIEARKDWDEIKAYVMYELVQRKFTTNAELLEKLVLTGDRPLVEGNTWNDTFWGVRLSDGVGQNILGKILMKVRYQLKMRNQWWYL